MLKWFKKITDRLFRDEIEEEIEEVEIQSTNTNTNTNNRENENKRPAFRFPMITDAEIYGWDDEDENSEQMMAGRERLVPNDSKDEFEPTPLHQNERWPVEQQATIHRVRPSLQDEQPLPVKRTEKSQALKTELESLQKKRRTERFTPSKVPSPIYGYKMPKQKKEETVEPTIKSDAPMFKAHVEKERLIEKSPEENVQYETLNESNAGHEEVTNAEPQFTQEALPEETDMSSEEAILENQSDQASHEVQKEVKFDVVEKEAIEDLSVVEEVVVQEEPELMDETIEVISEETQPEANEVEQSTLIEDAPTMEELSHEDMSSEEAVLGNQSDQASHEVQKEAKFDVVEKEVIEDLSIVEEVVVQEEPELMDETIEVISEELQPEVNEVEQSTLVEDAPTMEEPSHEEVLQERVVPFNVLMLKSDKKKLKALEIANEMKAKVKRAEQPEMEPIIEEPPKMAVQEAPTFIEEEPEIETVEVDTQSEVAGEDLCATLIQEAQPSIVEEVSQPANIEEPVEEIIESPAFEHYVLPTIDYLIPPESQIEDTEWLAAQSEKLEESLSHFGVQANVINAVQGPTVTRFELTVGQGTKVSRVRNLADDLKLTLAARDIRIQAPIPGESAIGIEIPNRKSRAVRISEVIETKSFQSSESPLEAVLGLGLTGEPVTLDLRKMPHGMIAGATGSGKSVCINSILVSLLYKASPADLKMMLIDPKMVELAPFNGIPHLISPVITDVKAATAALKWAVTEMDRRYELLAHAGVRDIERYNEKAVSHRQFSLKLPYLLIVIDELADLMMMAPADVEVSISRIAQKARACGIHLIIATQRPSVDVITGIIKANIPTRIAFSVSSQVDSRTMIDTNGAERLLGRGDMLYVGSGESAPVRLQGTFVTDDEIERIIEHVQNEASPSYLFGQDELLKSAVEDDEDPLFVDACMFIFEQDSASTSMLQRNFSIGYNRAAKLMDRFEKLKFISPQQGSRARDVYLTEEQLNELKETIL